MPPDKIALQGQAGQSRERRHHEGGRPRGGSGTPVGTQVSGAYGEPTLPPQVLPTPGLTVSEFKQGSSDFLLEPMNLPQCRGL